MTNYDIKTSINNLSKVDVYKFLLLVSQLSENETVNIGVCTIRKVSESVFKLDDVKVEEMFEVLKGEKGK